jgi:hypothetical protein
VADKAFDFKVIRVPNWGLREFVQTVLKIQSLLRKTHFTVTQINWLALFKEVTTGYS